MLHGCQVDALLAQRIQRFRFDQSDLARTWVGWPRRIEAHTFGVPIARQPDAGNGLDGLNLLHPRAARRCNADCLNPSHSRPVSAGAWGWPAPNKRRWVPTLF